MKKLSTKPLCRNTFLLGAMMWIVSCPVHAGDTCSENRFTAPSLNDVSAWNKQEGTYFIPNHGQFTDSSGRVCDNVLYKARLAGMEVYITPWGLSYFFLKTEKKERHTAGAEKSGLTGKHEMNGREPGSIHWQRVDLELYGAFINKEKIEESEPADGLLNYYIGKHEVRNLKAYRKIKIKDIYPGIDWEIYVPKGNRNAIEYDFIVHAGADYRQIGTRISGPKGMIKEISAGGDELKINTSLGKIIQNIPKSFLKDGTEVKEVKMQYKEDSGIIRFLAAPSLDSLYALLPGASLVIDPYERLWATYYDSDNDVFGHSIYSDGTKVWVTGYTTATAAFPVYDPPGGSEYYDGSVGGSWDAFILCFDASTYARLWATFFGGTRNDLGYSIHSAGGKVWVTGYTNTNKTDGNPFPLYDPAGATDYYSDTPSSITYHKAFIAAFSATTMEQLWCTFYGGANYDYGYSIHSDGTKVWVALRTFSETTTAPIMPTYDPAGATDYFDGSCGGCTASSDAFLIAFDASTYARLWATYIGGTGTDAVGTDATPPVYGSGRYVYSDGSKVWMTGWTNSTAATFPDLDVAGATDYYDGIANGLNDAFILCFSASTYAQLWGTYIGGASDDYGYSIQSDGTKVWVTGVTASAAAGFPDLDVAGATDYYDGVLSGASDAFILCFKASDYSQLWGTYLGGASGDEGYSIHSDGTTVWVTGYTASNPFSPVYDPPGGSEYFDNVLGGSYDAFIVAFNASDYARNWGTHYGGASGDEGYSIHSDGTAVWVTGSTYSSEASFPLLDPAGATDYFDGTCGACAFASSNAFILSFNEPAGAPVELLFFTGICNNLSATLYWQTASESNSDYFTVERNKWNNGRLEEWKIAGTIKSAGNSSTIRNYEFVDASPLSLFPPSADGGGRTFYRLKQTDYNGNYEYFSPITVSCSPPDEWQLILQNISITDELIATLILQEDADLTLEITDLMGRKISSKQLAASKGGNLLRFALKDMANGVYFLKISSPSGRSGWAEKQLVSKFVKM